MDPSGVARTGGSDACVWARRRGELRLKRVRPVWENVQSPRHLGSGPRDQLLTLANQVTEFAAPPGSGDKSSHHENSHKGGLL